MISISQSIDLVDLFRDRKEEYEKIHTYSHSLTSNKQKSLNTFYTFPLKRLMVRVFD